MAPPRIFLHVLSYVSFCKEFLPLNPTAEGIRLSDEGRRSLPAGIIRVFPEDGLLSPFRFFRRFTRVEPAFELIREDCPDPVWSN